MKIVIIGTGNVGRKLGGLVEQTGYETVYGSSSDKAAISEQNNIFSIADAATQGDIVIFAIPFSAYDELLPALKSSLAHKTVVDVSNPINADWSPLLLGAETSAGEIVQTLLPDSQVVKAFNTVFADIMTPDGLLRGNHKVTTFVASDHDDAAQTISSLAEAMGFNAVVTGSIQHSRYLEAMAHLNIQLAVGQGGGTDAAFVYM